jgi:GAF domain-containing protein
MHVPKVDRMEGQPTLSSIDSATHGVLDAARDILEELDEEILLDQILESARELAGARYGAIGVLTEDGTRLARFLTSGIDDATSRRIGLLPSGRGVLGELIGNPVPLRLADVEDHPHSFGFPSEHPPMHSFLGVPIFIAGQPFGNLYLTEREDGEQFSEDDETTLVLLAEFAGLAIDNAQRYARSEARRQELQRSVDALETTVKIAGTLAGQTDLDVVLELVAKRGRDLVSARAFLIELIDGDDLLVAAVAGELPQGGLIGRRVPIRSSAARATIETGRAQRLENDLDRTRFSENGLGRLGFDVGAGLVVPLVLTGRSYGVLVALGRLEGGSGFTGEDVRLLESFAAGAATAVATAQSVAAERRHDRLAAAE